MNIKFERLTKLGYKVLLKWDGLNLHIILCLWVMKITMKKSLFLGEGNLHSAHIMVGELIVSTFILQIQPPFRKDTRGMCVILRCQVFIT